MNFHSRFPTLRFDTDTVLPRAHLAHDGAKAEIFLQGAHLARFATRSGDELLWVSAKSHFEEGHPIRGGVPLIFPYFGPKKDDARAPAHGFARTMDWQIESADESSLSLILEATRATLVAWPHRFRLRFRLAIAAEKLSLALQIHNTGEMAFEFETAFHTYLRVSDVRNIVIDGLDGKTYFSKVENRGRQIQSGPIRIESETDRIYFDSPGPITLHDLERTVRISDLGGVKSSVVWNPWVDKSRALADLGDDEWPGFVCIESGVIADDAGSIEAGKSYEMGIEIELLGAK